MARPTRGGRCEVRRGDGRRIKVARTFCRIFTCRATSAKAKRYNRETLEIKYKGKTIHEVLGYDFIEEV